MALTATLAVFLVLLGGMFAYAMTRVTELDSRLDALDEGVAKTGYALKDFEGVILANDDVLDHLATGLDETKAALEALQATGAEAPAADPQPQASEPRKVNTHMSVIDEYRSRGGVE